MKLRKRLQQLFTGKKREAIALWPKIKPSSIYEERYAQQFCLEKIKSLVGEVIFYDPDKDVDPHIHEIKADKLVVFNDPYTYISSKGLEVLLENCEKGTAVFPVYSAEATCPEQLVQPPFTYVDPLSFEEAAKRMVKYGRLIEVSNPDSACFVCKLEDLSFIGTRKIKKIVHTGALAHRFINMFSSPREDLIELVPQSAQVVLDVGCAEGRFGKRLKEKYPRIIVDGVEPEPLLAEKARKHYREVYEGHFEDVKLNKNSYDVINMGDVLEHMYDPWNALKKASELLKPGGFLIGSVPNASHWSIVRQLVIGNFDYIPVGLLCISHIRFFTLKTLSKSLEDAGFILDEIKRLEVPPTPKASKLIEEIAKNIPETSLKDLYCAEILFKAKKP